jgi:hypothetical protein
LAEESSQTGNVPAHGQGRSALECLHGVLSAALTDGKAGLKANAVAYANSATAGRGDAPGAHARANQPAAQDRSETPVPRAAVLVLDREVVGGLDQGFGETPGEGGN